MRLATFLLAFLCVCINVLSQEISAYNIIGNDIVFNKYKQKLYAVVSGSDFNYGNSLVRINPYKGIVEDHIFIGSNPQRIKLTDDGQFAYVSYHSLKVIKRVDLSTFKVDQEIILVPLGSFTPFYILDFEIVAGTNDRIVVSRSLQSHSEYFEDLILYVDGKAQPKTITKWDSIYSPEIIQLASKSDGKTLLGYNSSHTGFENYRIAISDDGVSIIDYYTNLIETFGKIKIFNDIVLSANGRVINPFANAPYIMGIVNINGMVTNYGFTYSEPHNAYIFPYHHITGLYFNFYDKNTFRYIGSVPIPVPENLRAFHYEVVNMEVVNHDKIAFILTDIFTYQQLLVIDVRSTVYVDKFAEKEFDVFPNPAKDFINISGNKNIREVKIFATDGRLVYQGEMDNENKRISLMQFTKGLYLLQVTYTDNTVQTRKIIKD